ncbi:MAG: Hpt domain-containing protein, partial [Polyangiaceae bacterium]|nr:Hpt domain-containing protein [Polyangiaceae bacterium]
FRELVGIFITDAPMRIERMRSALGSGDGRELAQQAHALKGSAGNLAATRVQQLAGDIEARARAGELDTVSRLLEEVQREFTAVRLFLEDTVAESESA